MALARIQKIGIIGLRGFEARLLDLLKKRGCVQLIHPPPAPSAGNAAGLVDDASASDLSRLEETISYLDAFGPKSGFMEGMAGLKPFLFSREAEELVRSYDWRSAVEAVSDARRSLTVGEQRRGSWNSRNAACFSGRK